ncbi:MAG: class I SAM-dependent methyltransferase [Myxococcota bacterium]
MGSWDDEAAAWDDDPVVRAFARAVFESLEALLRERGARLDGARILDFGCGTGLMSERFGAARSVLAVDASPKMIDVLERKALPNVTARTAPAGADDAPFDLIVASSVCGFLPDYPGTLATLAGTLTPGGLFVQWDWERPEDGEDQGFGLERRQIEAALRDAGLEERHVATAFAVAVPGSDDVMRPLLGVGRRPAKTD